MPRAGPVGPVARPAACQTNRAGDRLDRLLDLNRATSAGHGPVRLLASDTGAIAPPFGPHGTQAPFMSSRDRGWKRLFVLVLSFDKFCLW